MLLFHGTTLKAYRSIEKQIDVYYNADNETDFGYGFYLGDEVYARQTAHAKSSVARRAAGRNEGDCIPILLAFEVDEEAILRKYKCLVYKHKNMEFLNNVFISRYNRGKDMLKVDYISAPMADGMVNNVMKYYMAKESAFRKSVALFRYWLPVFHRQRVIKNPDVLKFVHLMWHKQV